MPDLKFGGPGLRRAGERALSVVLLAGVVIGSAMWVRVTREPDLRQAAVPDITLTAAQLRSAEAIPHYRTVIPVLTFHTVGEDAGGQYELSLVQFTQHMQALHQAGFHTVELGTLEDFVRGLPVQLPDRPILLTFDDGHASDYTRVDPVLARYGFTATAFLITGAVRVGTTRSYYLDVDQIRALENSGRWRFGGHTHNLHRMLPSVGGGVAPALDHRAVLDGRPETLGQWRSRVGRDLRDSQAALRRLTRLGPASAFAYPFGAFGQDSDDPGVRRELPELLVAEGYRVAFTGEQAEPAVATSAGDDPYTLHRFGIGSDSTPEDLLLRLRRAIPDPMPPDLTRMAWVGSGADCSSRRPPGRPAELLIRTRAPFSRCAGQANTSHWRDYRVEFDVQGASRRVTLVVRGRDVTGVEGHSRVELAIGESTARIREVSGGTSRDLAVLRLPRRGRSGAPPSRHVRLTFEGDTVRASVDSAGVVARLMPKTDIGGVGFAVAADRPSSVRLSGLTMTAGPGT